ncbi:MAG: type II toxin-antitoxin system RelE/ParE family toxin [Pirellulales bacterium]
MTRFVYLGPETEADIAAAFHEFESVRPGLGERFIAVLRKTLERLESIPELHGLVWRDVRAVRLGKFRHVLYYVVSPERIDVIAIIHGSRRAETWRDRLGPS